MKATTQGVAEARNTAVISSELAGSALNPRRHILVVAIGRNSAGSSSRISEARESQARNTEWVYSSLIQNPSSDLKRQSFTAFVDGKQNNSTYRYQWFRCDAYHASTSFTLPAGCTLRSNSDMYTIYTFEYDVGFYLMARATFGALTIFSETTQVIR
jgi:hypothetical protein